MSSNPSGFRMPPLTSGAASVTPTIGPLTSRAASGFRMPSLTSGAQSAATRQSNMGPSTTNNSPVDRINETGLAVAGLATGMIGFDAGLAFLAARAQNKALQNAMARVREQGATAVRQQQSQANDARRQRIRLQREAAGRLRVLRASGLGGSFDQRAANLNIDATQDLFSINRNLGMNVMSTTQSVNNNIINLNNQQRDPLLAGVTAGVKSATSAATAVASAMAGGA